MVADELRRQADNFIELMDIQDLIGRAPYRGGNNDAPHLPEDDDEDYP